MALLSHGERRSTQELQITGIKAQGGLEAHRDKSGRERVKVPQKYRETCRERETGIMLTKLDRKIYRQ